MDRLHALVSLVEVRTHFIQLAVVACSVQAGYGVVFRSFGNCSHSIAVLASSRRHFMITSFPRTCCCFGIHSHHCRKRPSASGPSRNAGHAWWQISVPCAVVRVWLSCSTTPWACSSRVCCYWCRSLSQQACCKVSPAYLLCHSTGSAALDDDAAHHAAVLQSGHTSPNYVLD